MKIIHLGNMGVGTVLTSALREIGHESQVVVDTPHPFAFEEDIVMFPGKIPSHFRSLKIRKTMRSIKNCDVFHMHGLQSPIYLSLLKDSKSKKVFHYHSPFDEPSPPEGLFDKSFVSIPTTLKDVPGSVWIPLPVDTRRFRIEKQQTDRDMLTIGVGSAFSDTSKARLLRLDLINKVVNELNNEGHKIAILEFRGYRHDQVLDYWKKIDLWIDRFDTGFYGWSSLEAASCSIPVLASIDENAKQHVPDCPFLLIEANIGNVKSQVEYLLSESARSDLGQRCKVFVTRKHDSLVVAQKCIEEYSK